MYVWIWRRLPGGLPGKLAGTIVLLAGVVALLFFLVFPWVEPRLPFNHVNIGPASPTAPPASTPATPGTPN